MIHNNLADISLELNGTNQHHHSSGKYFSDKALFVSKSSWRNPTGSDLFRNDPEKLNAWQRISGNLLAPKAVKQQMNLDDTAYIANCQTLSIPLKYPIWNEKAESEVDKADKAEEVTTSNERRQSNSSWIGLTIIELILTIPFFQSLSLSELNFLESVAKETTYQANSEILSAEDTLVNFYFIRYAAVSSFT